MILRQSQFDLTSTGLLELSLAKLSIRLGWPYIVRIWQCVDLVGLSIVFSVSSCFIRGFLRSLEGFAGFAEA